MIYPEELLRVELLFLGSDADKALDFAREYPRFHVEDIRLKLKQYLGLASPLYLDEFIIELEDAIRRLEAIRTRTKKEKPIELPADICEASKVLSKQVSLLYSEYEKLYQEIKRLEERIEALREALKIYKESSLPLPIPRELLSLHVRIGFVEELPEVEAVMFYEKRKEGYLVLIISDKPLKIDGEPIEIEIFSMTEEEIEEEIERLSRSLSLAKEKLENRKLSVAPEVEYLYKAASLLLLKISALSKGLVLLDTVYYLEGRVPKRDEEAFLKKLRKYAPGVLVLIREPSKDENPPTLFRPKSELKKASISLTDVYGITNYREINPSRVVLLTFPLFFGMMFADILHGFILALFGRTARKYAHKFPESLSMFPKGSKMIIYMGLRSMFFGALFGEFAGFEIEERHIGELLHEKIPLVALVSGGLSSRLIFLQYVSIIVAVLHITRGLLMNLVDKIKKRDFYRALFVSLPRLIAYTLFIGPVGYLLLLREVLSPSLYAQRFPNMGILDAYFYLEFDKHFLLYAILVGSLMFPGSIFIAKEHHLPKFDAFIEAGFIHFIEAFVTSLSNTVSYLRLLALNLAHTLLSTVFIDMGFHMVGGVAGIAIYLSGQILVLTIESISATLHAIRLHRVEFFSKLDLRRDGRRFEPLTLWV